jgi:hypothetical protein
VLAKSWFFKPYTGSTPSTEAVINLTLNPLEDWNKMKDGKPMSSARKASSTVYLIK